MLKKLGYKAGVYMHACDFASISGDFGTGTSKPDSIWLAYTLTGATGYDRYATTSMAGCNLGDTVWQNMRIRQYALDKSFTWNGISMNIDFNIAKGGQVAPTTREQTIYRPIRAFDHQSGGRGWVWTDIGLFTTSNQGMSWRDITPAKASGHLLAVDFQSADSARVVAKIGDLLLLFHTEDGGTSWIESLLPNDLFDMTSLVDLQLHFVDDKTGWLQGKSWASVNFSHGNLWRTQDGGATWKKLDAPTGEKIYVQDAHTAWTVWHNQLYRSNDGGASWAKIEQNISRGELGLPFSYHGKLIFPVTVTEVGGDRFLTFYLWNEDTLAFNDEPILTADVENGLSLNSQSQGEATFSWLSNSYRSINNPYAPNYSIASYDFSSDTDGWGVTNATVCNETGCIIDQKLIATQDGGESWATLSLENLDGPTALKMNSGASHSAEPLLQIALSLLFLSTTSLFVRYLLKK